MPPSWTTTSLLHLLLLAAASAHAHDLPELAITKRDKHTNGATNLFRRAVGTHQLERRAGVIGTNIFDVMSWSLGGAYYANVTVGTPPQPQTLILDTGSSDTYLDASTADECKLPEDDPSSCQGGSFDRSASSSYKEVHASPAFNASYGDGSAVVGPFGTEIFGIGDILISPVQFGVAEEITSTTGFAIGLMGIGYSRIEAVRPSLEYQNVPEVLAEAGIINSRLFSVHLNDDSAISGTILFGGIDRSLYTGDLATVDFLPTIIDGEDLGVVQFITTVTAASVTSGGSTQVMWQGGSAGIDAYDSSDSALPALLDTGSTAWTIPQSYFQNFIAPAFPFVDENGFCSCKYASSGDHLSLTFGDKISIDVDVSEFIVPYINSTTLEPVPYDAAGNDACVFLISAASADDETNYQPLGDAILRSMYVVFDLDNGQASIAQAAVNVTNSPDVVTVQAGATGVAAAISGVSTAAPNSYSIGSAVTVSEGAYSTTAAPAPIGTATGAAAVPVDAHATNSNSPQATTKGAAAGLLVPGVDLTEMWMLGLCLMGMVFGAGLVL